MGKVLPGLHVLLQRVADQLILIASGYGPAADSQLLQRTDRPVIALGEPQGKPRADRQICRKDHCKEADRAAVLPEEEIARDPRGVMPAAFTAAADEDPLIRPQDRLRPVDVLPVQRQRVLRVVDQLVGGVQNIDIRVIGVGGRRLGKQNGRIDQHHELRRGRLKRADGKRLDKRQKLHGLLAAVLPQRDRLAEGAELIRLQTCAVKRGQVADLIDDAEKPLRAHADAGRHDLVRVGQIQKRIVDIIRKPAAIGKNMRDIGAGIDIRMLDRQDQLLIEGQSICIFQQIFQIVFHILLHRGDQILLQQNGLLQQLAADLSGKDQAAGKHRQQK